MSDINQAQNTYVDLDELEYNIQTLRFLRKKLDDFTIDVFRQTAIENKNHRGLVKTRLENYHSMRKRYDAAFLILEAQGFIEKKEDGTSTPYFVTIRGRQLMTILNKEQKN
ncbi:hypothetical protein [Niallia endozanthoxylica]|uniref:Uncharacterized protein n=1 Tax=Niallia endozanthoxylica TaxID=2036016 RepID=A0A5J5H3P9_9BACI|nr:hypothetical protein [Niallia endozanthoxylica]KAA9014897.1 hypothetical protein F4V44_23130 [Niallia endozanthoxylica]